MSVFFSYTSNIIKIAITLINPTHRNVSNLWQQLPPNDGILGHLTSLPVWPVTKHDSCARQLKDGTWPERLGPIHVNSVPIDGTWPVETRFPYMVTQFPLRGDLYREVYARPIYHPSHNPHQNVWLLNRVSWKLMKKRANSCYVHCIIDEMRRWCHHQTSRMIHQKSC